MQKAYISILSVALLFVFSCGKPKAPEYVSLENIKVKEFGLKETKLGVEVKMFNPNNQRLQVRSADLDLYVNNELLGHSVLDSLVNIPKRDTFFIPLSINIQTLAGATRFMQSLADTSVLLKVQGIAKLGKSGVFFNYPVNYEGRQSLGK